MAKEKNEIPTLEKESTAELTEYNFPVEGVTVLATSLTDAIAQLQKSLNK